MIAKVRRRAISGGKEGVFEGRSSMARLYVCAERLTRTCLAAHLDGRDGTCDNENIIRTFVVAASQFF